MKKAALILLLVIGHCALRILPACAQGLTSRDLISQAREYDFKEVNYEGEVIGEIMQRGNNVWLSVKDKDNALGVWADKGLAADIVHVGNYKTKGERVMVSGVFHQRCPQHGADMDIHAKSIEVSEPGESIARPINLSKINSALKLLGVLCLAWILILLKRR